MIKVPGTSVSEATVPGTFGFSVGRSPAECTLGASNSSPSRRVPVQQPTFICARLARQERGMHKMGFAKDSLVVVMR